jgi:predicted phage baseplate assembly protein
MVHFIGPQDFRASSEFGMTAFWLRVRWIRGAWSIRPLLKRVLTNTVWAEHTVTLTGEVLGASNGEPNQTFQITRTPLLAGQVLEVKEPEQPSALEREPLLLEEGDDAVRVETDEGGTITAVWVRWHQVADFYQSGPRSRHYVVDRITGHVRFGDGKRGMIPPIGRSNIRMASYQTGGGLSGNRNIGTVVQLKSTIPFVGSVTNWEPAGGGAPRETLDSVKRRGPKVLRHRDRAVAIADYEDLAFEASTNVARAKGIPADSAANAGQTGLIIVPNSTEAKPIPSMELLQRVEDYIRDRLSPTVDLWVVGPDWLEVSVYVEVVPTSVEKATGVKAAVLSTLASFLHPLTGGLNGEGWSFGRKPYRSDLYASIENIDTVDHVRRLIVEESGEVEAERFLVFSGTHEVEVVSNTQSRSGGTL